MSSAKKRGSATGVPVIGRFLLVFSLLMLAGAMTAADTLSELEKEAAYHYLNRIRQQAGLPEFAKNLELEVAAQAHAAYLVANDTMGHLESGGLSGFTGSEPADRALAAGYASKAVTENFSAGQADAKASIDGLMGAIYHRLSFLDLLKDEIGVGIVRDPKGFKFVYKMGSRGFNRFCRFAILQNDSPYYEDVCAQVERVAVNRYDQRRREILKNNPLMVVWPPPEARDIPVVFYEESPDPLPEYSVSGYPVSLQLNPYYYRIAEVIEFQLFKEETGEMVRPVKILNRQLDPNHRLTETQYVLFPLARLEWDTVYRVRARLLANGRELQKSWTFRTRRLPFSTFFIPARNDYLLVKSGQPYAVHIPPTPKLPLITDLHWETRPGVGIDVAWEDANTVVIRLVGNKCDQVRFFLNGGRTFQLMIDDREGIEENANLSSCTLEAIQDLPGFRIDGRGETIQMVPGREYWIEIATAAFEQPDMRWRYADGMRVDVHQLDSHIYKIRLEGDSGQAAEFFLSRDRSFKIILTNLTK